MHSSPLHRPTQQLAIALSARTAAQSLRETVQQAADWKSKLRCRAYRLVIYSDTFWRRAQPKPARAEPNSQTAAGTGTMDTTMLSNWYSGSGKMKLSGSVQKMFKLRMLSSCPE